MIGVYFAQHAQKCFLNEVLCEGAVATCHPKKESQQGAIMPLDQQGQIIGVTALNPECQLFVAEQNHFVFALHCFGYYHRSDESPLLSNLYPIRDG